MKYLWTGFSGFTAGLCVISLRAGMFGWACYWWVVSIAFLVGALAEGRE